MNKNLRPKILELREQGLSYNQIVDKLGCSKGTVSFHLGEGQKEKTRKRRAKYTTIILLLSSCQSVVDNFK